ncbi:MAG: hypothetical protein KAW12_19120 [Candidatus Aminicenantes bacterium]|nr:hypothetical protein [Candidatus Aminicenantes bacterium]
MKPDYKISVFINCPFDQEYSPIFQSLVFTVIDCGYIARCAREISDSGEVRIDKIVKIISGCKYGIHDISRTDLDKKNKLPRFNMPLELGIFLGAKRFGKSEQKKKICLILDSTPFRYQSFISDIAGQDIQAHNNKDTDVIKVVRNWLRSTPGRDTIPGGTEILKRYRQFTAELPVICERLRLTIDEMVFSDYINIISEWLKENPSFPQ